jgi:hypothetical protein
LLDIEELRDCQPGSVIGFYSSQDAENIYFNIYVKLRNGSWAVLLEGGRLAEPQSVDLWYPQQRGKEAALIQLVKREMIPPLKPKYRYTIEGRSI